MGFEIFFLANFPLMLQVGITGGIGSGKTTVCRIFGVLGVPVYYADDAAKRLMNESPLRESIIEHFGKDAYAGQQLDRAYLAAQVFNNQEKLDLLNSLVHPVTIADAAKWMSEQTYPYALKEAALLFESGSNRLLDYVIGVSAPVHLRISRTVARDQSNAEAIQQRMNRQMDEEEKMKRCDFVLINDEKHLLIPQVIELHQHLLRLSNEKP